jgi:hypothetical protein
VRLDGGRRLSSYPGTMPSSEVTSLDWALGVVRDAADRGARFVLPAELERGGIAVSESVRMTLTVPTPAIGAVGNRATPPTSTAMEAVTYLACWAAGGLLLAAHWRLPRDDPFARSLQGVLQTLRLVLRPAT